MLSSCKARYAITKVRISAHNLPIEKGRYINLTKENRLCTFCKAVTGDEYHCIFKCFHPKLLKIRNEYLCKIYNISPQLKLLSRQDMFKYIILAADNSIIDSTGHFLYNILDSFK